VKQRLQILGKRVGSILFLCLLLILCDKNSALAQNRETDCEQVKGQWEQLYQEMKDKLDGFTSLEQTPIERIIKKPKKTLINLNLRITSARDKIPTTIINDPRR
jgi:hypothetical protein